MSGAPARSRMAGSVDTVAANRPLLSLLFELGPLASQRPFAVRGAWSFALWTGTIPRATSDLDLAIIGEAGDPEGLLHEIRSMFSTGNPVGNGGCPRNTGAGWTRRTSLQMSRADDNKRSSFKVHVAHHVGTRRHVEYFDLYGRGLTSALKIACLSREWMIAEKAALLVTYGVDHTRLQDIFDLWQLACSHPFDGESLSDALKVVFQARDAELMLSRNDGYWEASLEPEQRSDAQHGRWTSCLVPAFDGADLR